MLKLINPGEYMNQSKNYFLYFKDLYLGRLNIKEKNKLSQYTFFCEDFDKIEEKYFFVGDGCLELKYEINSNTENKFGNKIPLFFQNLINQSLSRDDVVSCANIDNDDKDENILDKLANINIQYGEFIFSNRPPQDGILIRDIYKEDKTL